MYCGEIAVLLREFGQFLTNFGEKADIVHPPLIVLIFSSAEITHFAVYNI